MIVDKTEREKEDPRIHFWPGAEGEAYIGASGGPGSRSARVKRALLRHARLMEDELAEINLSQTERRVVARAIGGIEYGTSRDYLLMWRDVAQRVPLSGVPGDESAGELIEKLMAMTPGQSMAIVEAVERGEWDPEDET